MAGFEVRFPRIARRTGTPLAIDWDGQLHGPRVFLRPGVQGMEVTQKHIAARGLHHQRTPSGDHRVDERHNGEAASTVSGSPLWSDPNPPLSYKSNNRGVLLLPYIQCLTTTFMPSPGRLRTRSFRARRRLVANNSGNTKHRQYQSVEVVAVVLLQSSMSPVQTASMCV